MNISVVICGISAQYVHFPMRGMVVQFSHARLRCITLNINQTDEIDEFPKIKWYVRMIKLDKVFTLTETETCER